MAELARTLGIEDEAVDPLLALAREKLENVLNSAPR